LTRRRRKRNRFEMVHGLVEARAVFVDLVRRGATYESIGKSYDVDVETAARWAKLYQVNRSKMGSLAKPPRPEAAELRRVYQEHGAKVAAAVFRCSEMTILRWRRIYGIENAHTRGALTFAQHSARSKQRWKRERERTDAEAFAVDPLGTKAEGEGE